MAASKFDFQIPPGRTFHVLKEKISPHPSLPFTTWRSGLCQRGEWEEENYPLDYTETEKKEREYDEYAQLWGEFLIFWGGCSPVSEGLQGKPLDV